MTEQVALYRRYRATTFGELRGQDPIAKTLRRAVAGVLREVIAQQGAKQPGVHVGTEAFPLGRPV